MRGVAAVAGEGVAGVGSANAGSDPHGLFEVRDDTGASVALLPFQANTTDFLLGVVAGPNSALAVGLTSPLGDGSMATPLLIGYRLDGPGNWVFDWASSDTGQLDGFVGQLFDVATLPDGSIVAVGSIIAGDETSDAGVMLFAPGGDYVDGPAIVGEGHDDDFTGVGVGEDGSVIAVGRLGSDGGGARLLIARFTVGNSIESDWTRTWGETVFSNANGVARDGDALFIAAGTAEDPSSGELDTAILRWDGDADAPTWVVPYAEDSPGLDFAGDVALGPESTIVACGAFTPPGADTTDAWIRKLHR
jgi:hypothetical protein